MNSLTQERLKELVHYDPETGVFTRIKKTSNNARIGSPIGVIDTHGYLECSIDSKRYRLHRLAWMYVTGNFPDGEIDHISTVRTDNRFANLRDVSRSVNMQNKREASKNNKSGFLGVYFHKPLKKFTAQIRANGKNKHLGFFETAELAHAAYLLAKREFHAGGTI